MTLEKKYRRAFSETCDPLAYVPRASSEDALLSIRRWIESTAPGSTVAALIGSPGIGKTHLMRVVEAWFNHRGAKLDGASGNARDHASALYLPYASLTPVDLCRWTFGLLGLRDRYASELEASSTAIDALIGLGHRAEEPFLLILDDADSMPPETLREIVARLPDEGSRLKILFALNLDSKASRLLAALHPLHSHDVLFRRRMTQEETHEYLHGRMRWAGFTESEIEGIDEEGAARIHALSSGIPRRVHAIATGFYESGEQTHPTELESKRRREYWMGQPLDEDSPSA